jgi:pyridoxamine 5'-phosphate oxidase
MTTDPHPWAATLDGLYTQAWARLVRGVADRRAPARHPTLATVSSDGWPEARTVVLRAADPVSATLDLHTDLRSAKVMALQSTPCAALHIWDQTAHLQIRITADVTILTGDSVAATWAKVPEASRHAYATTPAPGQAIPTALAYRAASDHTFFAVLRCTVQSMDILHLGPDHRRAAFDRASGWAGMWLSP